MNINATLFAQAIVFAILVWFTMKFVWPPIAKALDERALKISEGLASAEKAKIELAAANKRVDEELGKSRNEADVRLADAERRGQALIEEAKTRASEEAAKIMANAQQEAQGLVTLRVKHCVKRLRYWPFKVLRKFCAAKSKLLITLQC